MDPVQKLHSFVESHLRMTMACLRHPGTLVDHAVDAVR
jgi:hypothetical protein